MRLSGQPEQYICTAHIFATDVNTRRERWLFEMEANRLCDADIGGMVVINSPSERMVKLIRIVLIERTVLRIDDSKPMPLIVLQTDDGDWEMRRDKLIWLDASQSKGTTIRWPVDEAETRWTTVQP